ncbi:unnamed protein product [Penicillium nalgiovense]|nr:unnamed protein product [Penicillium nalgiovense]
MRAPLRALFPYNNITRKGPAGLICLHLSTKTAHTQNPILFAESGLCLEQSLGDSKWLKNSTTKHQTFSLGGADATLTPARLQQEVKRQLVLPWTQILCLFLDSVPDIQAATNLLQRPRRQLTIGDEVVPAPLQECAQLQKLDTGTVTILDLRPRHGLSDSVVFQPLQTLIVKQLSIVQAERISNCRRFSASHLSAFWSTGVQSHERLLHAPPFDLLERARRDYVRNKTMDDCLREVMQTCIGYSKEDFDDLVASAFLMDAYPPQMHGMTIFLDHTLLNPIKKLTCPGFSPTVVFAALYEKRCLSIWDNEFKYHIAGVSSRFVHHFVQLSAVKTSAAIRKETLCRLYRR